MQSKTSFFNPTVFKKNLAKTWVVGLLYFLILTFMIPVILLMRIFDGYSIDLDTGYTAGYYLVDNLSTMSGGILPAFVSIAVVIITFWYLFNKRDSYMIHSFPVSRPSLFVTGIISSTIVVVIPIILTGALTTIVAVAAGASYIHAIWYWVFIECIASIFYIGFSAFTMMLTGQGVTAIIFYWILNFVYIGMEFTFKLLLSTLSFGLGSIVADIRPNCLTPIAFIKSNCGIVYEVKWNEKWDKILQLDVSMQGTAIIMGYLASGIALLVIAFLLYKYKKLETVNEFIAIPFVKPIFSIGMSFFISVVLSVIVTATVISTLHPSYNTNYNICIICALILGIIIFYVTQMIIAKSVRVFVKKNAMYCGIYSVCALAVLLGVRFDVLRIENKVPEISEIEWVGIAGDYAYVLERPEEIATVQQFHKEIIGDKKEIREMNSIVERNNETDSEYFTIKYQLKNGKTISRSYVLADSKEMGSERYVKLTSDIFKFYNDPQRIKEHIVGPFYDDCTVTDLEFSNVVWNEEGGYYANEYVDQNFASTGEKMEAYEKIYKAFIKDIEAGAVYDIGFSNISDENDYYNDLSITIKSNKGKFIMDEDKLYGWGAEPTDEKYLYVNLGPDCKNTIQALLDTGIMESEDALVTNKTVWDSEESMHK